MQNTVHKSYETSDQDLMQALAELLNDITAASGRLSPDRASNSNSCQCSDCRNARD